MTSGQAAIGIDPGAGIWNAVRRFGVSPTGSTPAIAASSIGPGAGGVDDDRGSEACLRRLDDPASAAALDRFDARIGEDLGAALAGGAQEAPVQPVDVELARVRLDDGAGDIVAAQHRHKLDAPPPA